MSQLIRNWLFWHLECQFWWQQCWKQALNLPRFPPLPLKNCCSAVTWTAEDTECFVYPKLPGNAPCLPWQWRLVMVDGTSTGFANSNSRWLNQCSPQCIAFPSMVNVPPKAELFQAYSWSTETFIRNLSAVISHRLQCDHTPVFMIWLEGEK